MRGLGEVLADGHGFTLYADLGDRHGTSSCYEECAEQWPPLLLPRGVSLALAGPGVEATLLGTTRRSNGAVQVTYDGWPLYLYALDQRPGQATGQSEDMGLWYVVSPDGAIDRHPLAG